MKYYISQTPASPLARIIAAVVATVSLAAAFFFGLVILAVIAVVIALFSLVFWLRILWLRRGAPAAQQPFSDRPPAQSRAGAASQDFIEAEYTVISERRD
jgi:hypothetical protein